MGNKYRQEMETATAQEVNSVQVQEEGRCQPGVGTEAAGRQPQGTDGGRAAVAFLGLKTKHGAWVSAGSHIFPEWWARLPSASLFCL